MKFFPKISIVFLSLFFIIGTGLAYPQETATEVITLKNSLAAPVVKRELDAIKSTAGKVVYNESTGTFIVMDVPDKLKEMIEKVKTLDIPVERKVLDLQNLKTEDAVKTIEPMLTPGIGLVNVIKDNELEVIDTSEKVKAIERAIWEKDRKKISLSVKVEVIQIILNDEHLSGVDWEAILMDFQSKTFKGFGDSVRNKLSFGSLNQEDFEVLVDALESVGDMRPIANYVKDEVSGDFSIDLPVKDLLFIPNQDAINKRNHDDQVKYSVAVSDVQETGCQIIIDPQYKGTQGVFGVDGKIAMTVEPGNTLIAGGLFKNVMIESMRKIPLLGDIPFLGAAFRTQGHRHRKTEIVVFIKPLIKVEKK
ncbi:MAG: hypothetical protein HQL26_05905 [Candidatus Omnitrophica bacterium]|nr:hypothetical protein [Candidatus Omnitrophota bacterium]